MKKTRGLRRQLRRARAWRQVAHPLDENLLASHHYDYLKLGLRPWSDWFYARTPPPAIRHELLTGLLATLQQWQFQLISRQQPFYLAVWLFEPRFSCSQVVVGVAERVGYYANTFGPPAASPAPLSEKYRAVPGAELLHWSRHANIEVYDEWTPKLAAENIRPYTTSTAATCYGRQTGWVWVGTLPPAVT